MKLDYKPHKILLNFTALILFALTSCISKNTPPDLTFVSVQAVDWHNEPELPGLDANPLRSMAGDYFLVLKGGLVSSGEKPHHLLLKVNFESKTNLDELALRRSSDLVSSAFKCSDKMRSIFSTPSPQIGQGFVYWRNNELNPYNGNIISDHSGTEGSQITYHIFLYLTKAASLFDNRVQPGFDLLKQPEDVCFSVGGFNPPFGFESNIVIIPKASIVMALQNIPTEQK